MGIDISLKAGENTNSSSINASGKIIEPINDTNKKAFGIDNKALINLVNKYNKFTQPFMLFDYKDVVTTLEVTGAEILGITSQPIIVKTQEFVNNSDVTGTFNVAITDSVSDTASNNWSTGGTLTFTQKISYGMGFIGKGETSISYSQSWGIGGSHSVQYTIGSNSGVTVTLDPGQSILAELSASRGVLKAKVYYNAYIDGTLHVIYGMPTFPPFNLNPNIPIKNLMSFGGLNNSVPSSEIIEVGYYSNSKIELKRNNGQLVSTYFL